MVQNINVEQLTGTSVNVSWTPIVANEIRFYTVCYRAPGAVEKCQEVDSSLSSVVINELMSEVDYQFHVRAKAEFGGNHYDGIPVIIQLANPTCKER